MYFIIFDQPVADSDNQRGESFGCAYKGFLSAMEFVDMQTGYVLEARLQTRIIAWIQDKRKPVAKSNADKDNETIVSLANMTTFKLKQ